MDRTQKLGVFVLASVLVFIFCGLLILINLPEWWVAMLVFIVTSTIWARNIFQIACWFCGHSHEGTVYRTSIGAVAVCRECGRAHLLPSGYKCD